MMRPAPIGRWGATLLGVLLVSGCHRVDVSLTGRPCTNDDNCLAGYVCHPETHQCVKPVAVSCTGVGYCPTTVKTGDRCPSTGSFIPCEKGYTNCDAGCRTCQPDGTWSACTQPVCHLGRAESCATCDDDCLAGARVTSAVCDTSGASYRCRITGCKAGWGDVDQNAANGCEAPCVPSTPRTEVCDGIDNDCDGIKDNPGAVGCTPYYRDADGDGYGDSNDEKCLCQPEGEYTATRGGDCDDSLTGCGAACHPGATEVCDGFDNDCNGKVDDGTDLAGCERYYPDADGDGYGAAGDYRCLCQPDATYVTLQGGDCDDNPAGCGAACHPNNSETCDGQDDDCDGIPDDNNPAGCTQYYADRDNDGYGDPNDTACLCQPTSVYHLTDNTDCDDSCAACHPGGSEVCDGHDDDCNGTIDDAPAGAQGCTSYYVDADGDGYGDDSQSQCLCAPKAPYVTTVGGDCDDDPTACGAQCNPGGVELCDGYDNDCNGVVDDACGLTFTVMDVAGAGLVDDSVTALAVDGSGDLWVGTSGTSGEVSYLPAGATSFTTISGLKTAAITCVILDSNQNPWFGFDETNCSTSGTCAGTAADCGPEQVTAANDYVTPYCTAYMSTGDNGVWSMLPASNGDVWIGTTDDYAVYNISTNTITCDNQLGGPPTSTAQVMTYDAATPQSLWIGTGDAIIKCSEQTDCTSTCTTYADVFAGSAPAAPDDVRGLVLDDGGTSGTSDDLLWAGSDGKGVAAFPPSDPTTVKGLPAGDVLPSQNVQAMVLDPIDRRLYIGTDAGLAMLELPSGIFSTYTMTDAPVLPSNDITSLAVDTFNRVLWIGTNAGVVKAQITP